MVFYERSNLPWKNSAELKSEYIKLTYLYLCSRNCFNKGYMKYSYFKNLIRYATNENNSKIIRNIFDGLMGQQIIQIKKINGSTKYIFNPYNKKYKPKYKIIFN